MFSHFQTLVKAAPRPSFTPVRSGLLQRCTATTECDECRDERLELQRSSVNHTELSSVPPIVHEVLCSPGQPLDSQTRAFMESNFGHDFSKVRLHADERAGASARAVKALAYTVGNNLVFGAEQYSPWTTEGTRLIAHELTHVVQQAEDGTAMQGSLTIGQPHDSYEQEADRMAEAIAGVSAIGERHSATISALRGNRIQRRCAPCEAANAEETEEDKKPERKGFTYEDLLAGEVKQEEEPEPAGTEAGTPQKTSLTANAKSPATSNRWPSKEKFQRPHAGAATIECENGAYVVKLNDWAGKPCGISDCVTVHESSHIVDWQSRWPNGCKKADGTNQPNGYLPLGGDGYDAFLKKSECTAHTKDLECAEEKLKSATGNCKTKLKAYVKLTETQKAAYC